MTKSLFFVYIGAIFEGAAKFFLSIKDVTFAVIAIHAGRNHLFFCCWIQSENLLMYLFTAFIGIPFRDGKSKLVPKILDRGEYRAVSAIFDLRFD